MIIDLGAFVGLVFLGMIISLMVNFTPYFLGESRNIGLFSGVLVASIILEIINIYNRIFVLPKFLDETVVFFVVLFFSSLIFGILLFIFVKRKQRV
ncbi:MAG: hypothetical protein V1851_01970 [Patescibacteria group bacterium]